MSKNIAQNVKKRNWAFIIYPESAPTNWIETLQQTGLQGAVSPLHDKDVNPTGEEKKPHYHVIVTYSGPTSFNVVKKLTDSLCSPIPQALEQIRGYYRYLTHKDNPDKYQYDEKEIRFINGFCISDFIELSKGEILNKKREILNLIRIEKIKEYCNLIDFLETQADLNLLEIACNNTFFFDKYLTSRRNQKTAAADSDEGRRLADECIKNQERWQK